MISRKNFVWVHDHVWVQDLLELYHGRHTHCSHFLYKEFPLATPNPMFPCTCPTYGEGISGAEGERGKGREKNNYGK
jgi:hypothetical protein